MVALIFMDLVAIYIQVIIATVYTRQEYKIIN